MGAADFCPGAQFIPALNWFAPGSIGIESDSIFLPPLLFSDLYVVEETTARIWLRTSASNRMRFRRTDKIRAVRCFFCFSSSQVFHMLFTVWPRTRLLNGQTIRSIPGGAARKFRRLAFIVMRKLGPNVSVKEFGAQGRLDAFLVIPIGESRCVGMRKLWPREFAVGFFALRWQTFSKLELN